MQGGFGQMWWVNEFLDDKQAKKALGSLGHAMGMTLSPMDYTRRRAITVLAALEGEAGHMEVVRLQREGEGVLVMACLHLACAAVIPETLKKAALVIVRAEQRDMRGEDDCGMGRLTALGMLRRALVNGFGKFPLTVERKHVIKHISSRELIDFQPAEETEAVFVEPILSVEPILTKDMAAFARSEATRKGNETRGAVRRREITAKGNETRGPERRREISMRAAATIRARRTALAALAITQGEPLGSKDRINSVLTRVP